MKYKKDSHHGHREAIFIETAAWVFIIGVAYLVVKVLF